MNDKFEAVKKVMYELDIITNEANTCFLVAACKLLNARVVNQWLLKCVLLKPMHLYYMFPLPSEFREPREFFRWFLASYRTFSFQIFSNSLLNVSNSYTFDLSPYSACNFEGVHAVYAMYINVHTLMFCCHSHIVNTLNIMLTNDV